MARVEIYSSLVSVLSATPDSRWNISGLNIIKIKEEPISSDGSDNECVNHEVNDDGAATTRDSQSINYTDGEMGTSKMIIPSNEHKPPEGSSSTCLNINKNHVDNLIIFKNDSIKATNRIPYRSHVEIGKDVVNRRLRTRTASTLVECDICYVAFRGEGVLKSHKNYYQRQVLTCHICKLHLNTPMSLSSHRRSVHRGDDWSRFKYECSYCKLRFGKKLYLQQHIFHFHNINKILNGREFRRRLINRNIALEKTRIDSKSRDSQRNKRKCDDTAIVVGSPRKKLVISEKHNEISLPYEVKNNENNDINNDDSTNDTILPQQSISDNQNDNNNKSDNDNASLNQSVQRPLVQICGVPKEVEALLNDCESSDDNFSTYSEVSDSCTDSELSDTYESYSPIKKYSLRSTTNRLANFQEPNRTTLRKWAILQKRFDCRNCHVRLERLGLPLYINNESTKDIPNVGYNNEDETVKINSRPTVGMELKNLELAMKKLTNVNQEQDNISVDEKEHSSQDLQSSSEPTNEVPLSSEVIPITNSSTSKVFYISSLCQTRYTTKKKLVYHYLCFHTNPPYQECAVCRSRCANLTELTGHLMQHCIEIPESLHEKSPIDPKESCENSQEKYMCKGCKKKFWLVSFLRDHERVCEVVRASIAAISSNNQQGDNDIIADGQLSESILRQQLTQKSITDHSVAQSTQKSGDGTSIPPLCTVCHTKFKNVTRYSEHKKKYSSTTSKYYCGRCGTPFPSSSLLGAHTRTAHDHHLPTDGVCIICEQSFREKCSLRQHMLHIHNDELKADALNNIPRQEWNHEKTCRICKIIFPDRKCYVEHSMYYYDDNIIECPTCHETFSSQCKALNHKKKVHFTEDMQKEHINCCNICNEGFIYSSDLYSHMCHVHGTNIQSDQNVLMNKNKHETNRRGVLYMCRVCNEMFSTAMLLTDHQSEYSNSGSHNCSKCTRKCKTRSLLEKHIKLTHNGPPHGDQIKCHSCNEILESKASWHCHLKHFHTVSIVNEQSSEICGDGSFSLSKSSKHSDMAAITGDDLAEECGVGKISIVNGTENNSDPRTPHPIKIEYTCALCDMQFMNSIDLKTHSHNFGNTCIHNNSEIVNTNFSIASIYSVKLEDYEKLSNTKDDDTSPVKMNGENKVSEIKDLHTERETIDNTIKRNVIRTLDDLNSNYECKICLTNFPTRRALRKHSIKFSNTGDHECTICHRKFKNMQQFRVHDDKHESRKREQINYIPPHYCETCDERFASLNSKKYHFAHIHGILIKLPQAREFDNDERRKSTRQQSKLMYQTNLDTYVTRDSNDEKFEKPDGTFDESGMDSCIEMISTMNTNIDRRINLNTRAESEPSPATLNDSQDHRSTVLEFNQTTPSSSSVIVPDKSENEAVEKITEIVEIQEEIVEKTQKVIEVHNEIVKTDNDIIEVEKVLAEQEIEIVEEEEEIIEVEDISTTMNTSRALCDICGDVFSNRNELINHQKNAHDIELVIDTLSDTQEEYIDIELLSDDEVQYESSVNYNKTDLDIIFDSACVRDSNKAYATTRPSKTSRTYTKKNQLTCRICNSLFDSLNSLGEHLEKHHQTDSPPKLDTIQNPRVSSSSKIINIKGPSDIRYVQLCCKFCGKQFSNDSYLYAHIKNVHNYEVDVTAVSQAKLVVPPNNYLVVENSVHTDDTQNNSQKDKCIPPKQSKVAIVNDTSAIKILDDNVIVRKMPKSDSNISQNSINRNSTRFTRLIPISSKLIKNINNRIILPKPNQLKNNDMPR